VTGAYAYVATSSTTQEMLVVNVTTPTAPTLAATYNPPTTLAATTITGYGNTVLLGMSTTLDAINITTPTAPTRLGTFTAAGTINDVETDITGQYAFLGTSSTTGEFQVVNIGTPSAMTLAKTVDVTGTTSTVNGVDYSPTLDVAVGASNSTTQGVLVFTRN
jgi:large repetitive protein